MNRPLVAFSVRILVTTAVGGTIGLGRPVAANEPLFLAYELHPVSSWSPSVAVGDVTGDHLADAVLSSDLCFGPAECRLTVFPQTHLQTLTGPIEYPSGAGKSLAVGDFNGDGRGDVVLAGDGRLSFFFQDSAGTLLPPRQDPPVRGSNRIAAGDLDGDGRLDLVSLPTFSGGDSVLDLYFQTATGGFQRRTTQRPEHFGSDEILIADLDLDGRPDILLVGEQDRRVTFIHQKADGTFSKPTQLEWENADSQLAAAVGNFDADPYPEIVVGGMSFSAEPPSYLQILDQVAPREWQAGTILPAAPWVDALEAADLDLDGRTDLVALSSSSNLVQVYLQKSVGAFTLEGSYDLPFGNYHEAQALALGDLDADGLLDIAVANDNQGLLILRQRSSFPAPPPGPELASSELPGYSFKVRFSAGGGALQGALEDRCIPETACLSGAIPGRSEVFLRVVGPKPNGRMWPTLVKFSTSTVEVWLRQHSTGLLRYYRLEGARPGFDELPGLFDRVGFEPDPVDASDPLTADVLAVEAGGHPPPPDSFFASPHFPDFRFRARISTGDQIQGVRQEAACIEETLCLSGALAGRSEVFLRIVGPKPNGRLWPTIVKFTTSTLEIWIEQVSTGESRYYHIEGAAPGKDDLTGLFDRMGFAP